MRITPPTKITLKISIVLFILGIISAFKIDEGVGLFSLCLAYIVLLFGNILKNF